MRHPSEYKLTLLPPTPERNGMWYGYAVDMYCSPNKLDVTPDNVDGKAETPEGLAGDLWHKLQDYVDTINKETT